MEKNSPGPRRILVAVVAIVSVGTASGVALHPPSPPWISPAPAPVLEPHQHDVHEALQRVSDDPDPDRRVRALVDGARQHRRRDHHEGHVPRHVERHHRLRVAPVGAPLLELTRRRLPHQHRRSTAACGASQQEREGGSPGAVVTRAEERRVGIRRLHRGGGSWCHRCYARDTQRAFA